MSDRIVEIETLLAFEDYFHAAIRGDENKIALQNLWRTNMSVAVSRNLVTRDTAIAAKAKQEGREEVLKELGITLNSRIAKMEILDSKNPSSLRKGIVMAYRDIEEWERQNRTMRKRI
jgi:hypothetical protein